MKPCKEWHGARTKAGYGQATEGGIVVYVHRREWERANGRPIPAGMVICHRCDNPPCYEADHLFIGTRRDNSRDMAEKRRSTIGERNPHSKLTTDQVRDIRSRLATGEPAVRIAQTVGCHPSLISHIRHGRSWGRVS